MNHELEVKLQAYVDGELSASEARDMERLLAQDAEAKAIGQELSWMRTAIKGNELDRKVSDTREFYWSQIQRAIEAEERKETSANAPASPVWAGWRKFLAPLTALAVVAILAVSVKLSTAPQDTWLAEVENMADETDSVSFRSKTENMFVVWVYDKTDRNAVTESVFDESLFQ